MSESLERVLTPSFKNKLEDQHQHILPLSMLYMYHMKQNKSTKQEQLSSDQVRRSSVASINYFRSSVFRSKVMDPKQSTLSTPKHQGMGMVTILFLYFTFLAHAQQ